ncbi:hypothetical protein [Streptomyces sp. NPDC088775]|uniref:hypothetical protein n=1 Tax=Streptomyces sp. NPDC088775 TaxID=3365896 RepID=UPI003802FFC6
MEAVDDVAARDHVGGSEVFEGLTLGGVAGVDSAVDPDAQEDLRLGGLDGAADVGARVLPSRERVDLVRGEDVEARGDGVRLGRDVPQDERAAGVRVGAGVVEGGVEPVAGPGESGGEAVSGEGAVGVCERGDDVISGANRASGMSGK